VRHELRAAVQQLPGHRPRQGQPGGGPLLLRLLPLQLLLPPLQLLLPPLQLLCGLGDHRALCCRVLCCGALCCWVLLGRLPAACLAWRAVSRLTTRSNCAWQSQAVQAEQLRSPPLLRRLLLQTQEDIPGSQPPATQAAQAPGSQPPEGGASVKLPRDSWEEGENRAPFFANATLGYFGMGAKFAASDLSRRLHIFTRSMEEDVARYVEGEAPGRRRLHRQGGAAAAGGRKVAL
jgi:hypothetical protein